MGSGPGAVTRRGGGAALPYKRWLFEAIQDLASFSRAARNPRVRETYLGLEPATAA